MRYPRKRPESNHLLTVRGATLQIFATCPVVNTFFMAGTPIWVEPCYRSDQHARERPADLPTPSGRLPFRAAAGRPPGASCQESRPAIGTGAGYTIANTMLSGE